MGHFADAAQNLLNQYGWTGIFLLMFAENIGLPVPTEFGFIAGQSMVSLEQASYIEIFLIILSGKTIGSIISYFVGKYFAQDFIIKSRSKRLRKAQEIFAKWMKKYGSAAVFFSRLVGYVRPWASYLAGIGEIGFIPFLIYNILGSAVIIVATMLVLGSAVSLWQLYPVFRPVAVVLFFIFFFGFWIGLWIYNRRNKDK
ncbi:hypothetical protein COT77_03230 [Candidatus Berkelbacteria bacterium CG10_big_fil_rev_8_21_14_0_10_41_12]|uniref:VTT domain-containing protein n=1 Tax=Candidatus Berkelbacteria bacterium CG10_big_fil_rev_8_21_14_0_10_41_12 TaxID=1974513 RepID=A0A2M6WWI3_9BACT|nr:MAG: hypothetical protein COT77_03230 [Candidatus Berkelbacteria bacterium CG10_big_fil_rev_8_21_14_0_10_41_12]